VSGLPDGRLGPHAFVDDLDAPELSADDRHHLARVLRLRDGDPLTVSDGNGRWRAVRFGRDLRADGDVVVVSAPEPAITVAFAPVKGDRPEWVVQKLTEMGVDRIVPFVAARSVVRWDGERAPRQTERLRKVAREAAMQSRQVRLPVVDDVADFASVAALPGVALAERDGAPPTLAFPAVLVGPEGGWTPEERDRVAARVTLGDAVLRAETAAVLAGGLLAALRAGVVRTT
jgi:16S rRNA (uracil1498-N3)-methyltransferase